MTYIHETPGRLRLRLGTVKRNAGAASQLRQWLGQLDGVQDAEVNPLTGSVLIFYRADVTDSSRLIGQMRTAGWIAAPLPRPVSPDCGFGGFERAMARLVLQSFAEIVVERSLFALAAAIF